MGESLNNISLTVGYKRQFGKYMVHASSFRWDGNKDRIGIHGKKVDTAFYVSNCWVRAFGDSAPIDRKRIA